MSKTRVYELARELGLENKALLEICEQLGLPGKRSHSSSLDDDEADKIRRSVIRKAVSGKEESVRQVAREGGVVTEHRVGNVIRRRKKTPEEEAAAAAEASASGGPQIDLSEAPRQSAEFPPSAPNYSQERSAQESARALADSLFKAPSAAEEPVEEAVASGQTAEMDSTQTVSPVGERETAQEGVESTREGTEESGDKAGDSRKPKGARVLGKIELPQRPAPKRDAETSREGGRRGAAPGQQVNGVQTAEAARRGPGPVRPDKGKRRVTEVKAVEEDSDAPKRRIKKKQVLAKGDLLDYEGDRDVWRARKDKKKKGLRGDGLGADAPAVRPGKKTIKIDGEMSVGELARQLGVKVGEVISHLMNLGTIATINQLIDVDTAGVVAAEFGASVVNTSEDEESLVAKSREEDKPEDLVLRPPVVTVMGHVDHGKTSLLDAIRKTSVTVGEAGGITQHIGAYNVKLSTGGSVTFLDTPGHEAFTAMRSRGAKVTDIVVLVVAADDGVMPQTLEAINHAKAANVPIIVAINKIDKPGANIDRIKTQISEHGLVPEDWGGDTILVPVSAKTQQGVDTLLSNLYAQAEILELKANPNKRAIGTIVESKLERGRGPVMTVLIQAGTLRRGESFVAGGQFGKVRALLSDDGSTLESAGPSIPVEVIGASGVPLAGDDFLVLESEAEARDIAEQRQAKLRTKQLAARGGAAAIGLTLENFSELVKSGTTTELPLIIKGDVQGSVEAVSDALSQLAIEEVRTKVLHKAVGAITENDIQLAAASNAIIVGFNVRADARAAAQVEEQGVQIMYSRIIYELVDQVRDALKGKLAPKFKETTLGRVEVRQTFKVPRHGMIAGSYVVDGTVQRGSLVRLLRDNKVIFEGKMGSLRRFKDDVKEVQAGYECGIGIDGYSDIKDGDVIEVYKIEEVPVL